MGKLAASANSVLFRPLTARHEIKQVSESGVLSILKMCGNDVCSANPVEIAYLGFTDLLEVRALESALRAVVARENESQKREMVLSLARQLFTQPEQFGLQAKLRREWSGWITDLKQRSELRISLAEDLSRKVSELASEVKRLQKMVRWSKRAGEIIQELESW